MENNLNSKQEFAPGDEGGHVKRRYFRNKKLLILIIILLLYFLGTFSILIPIRGQIVNSVSGEPIPGLDIKREIVVSVFGSPGGPGYLPPKEGYSSLTDEKGEFLIGPAVFYKHFLPLASIYGDLLSINLSGSGQFSSLDDISAIDQNFHPIRRANFKYFQKNIIEIAPKVDDIAKCKGEQICVENNSLDLALENKEERLCLGLSEDRIYDRFACIKILAIAKKNPSICSLIRTSDPEVDADYEKVECSKMASLNFKLLSDLNEDDASNLSLVCDNKDWLIETRSLCKRSIGDDLYPL